MLCFSPEQLERLARNDLDPAQAAPLQDHLRECEACRRQVEQVREDERLLGKIKNLPEAAPTETLSGARSQTIGSPSEIGRYRILRNLGEGGRGVVYEAEQENPRRVVEIHRQEYRPGYAGLLALIRDQPRRVGPRRQHRCQEEAAHEDNAGTRGCS